MIVLNGTTDKLSVVTGSAGDVDIFTSYANYDAAQAANDRVTVGNSFNSVTTAVSTDVVTAPGSGISRNVKTIIICNAHASVSNLVTVNVTNGSVTVEWEKLTLLPGERLSYSGDRFHLYAADGTEKVTQAATIGQIYTTRLGTTVSNSTTTAAKVTGMDMALGVGVWLFEYFLVYQSGTAGTGVKLGVNHSGTVTKFVYDMYGVTANITGADANMDQDVLLTTGGLISAWAARAKSTSAPMITANIDTATSDMFMMISGLAVVTVAGNLELYHASETAVATSVMLDSALRATKIS